MNRKLVILVIILASAYAAVKMLPGEKQSLITESGQGLAVTVVRPAEKMLDQYISATGMLVPREDIAVLTELSGVRVIHLFVDVGDEVQQGQRLALLDAESLQLQARQLAADYQKARDEYARIEPIKDTGAVSRLSVIEKQTAMENAKARFDDAQLAVSRATITAPRGGVIYERRAIVGQLVSASEPLFKIAENGEIEAQLKLPEAEISRVSLQQKVTLQITGSEHKWQGTVRLVTPQVEPASRTAQVRVSIKQDKQLVVGSFVRGDIFVENQSGLSLPVSAIQEDSNGRFVWTLDAANQAVRQPISLTAQQDDVALIEGVSADMRVVARAGAFIKAGEKVNPVEAQGEKN